MNNKKENIIRLSGVFGLDLNNNQHKVLLFDAMNGIQNPEGFIIYCREKKDGVEYSNRVEKLDTLATRYKKIEEEVILESKFTQGERYARTLSGKVVECRNFIEENFITFEKLRGENQTEYFLDHELRVLKKIGSQIAVIEFSKINRLQGEIYKQYVESVRRKHIEQKALPINSRVQQIMKDKK